jgi:hypothetical protein
MTVKMPEMPLPDTLRAIFEVCRAADVASFKFGELEFVLQPRMPEVNLNDVTNEDLGLPPDPADVENSAPKRRTKRQKLTPDGEVIVDPQNPSNPNNPIDFSADFPQGPNPPGYGAF